MFNNAADIAAHSINHAGIYLHRPAGSGSDIFVKFVPRLRPSILSDHRMRLPILGNYA